MKKISVIYKDNNGKIHYVLINYSKFSAKKM